ncbi:MAG: hypothetical protein KC503_28725, partial [Myxococcales bacterium]|nr:hypothetical protein [Myxococcales bacterium]
KRALVTAGERPHRAARLDRPTRSGIARAQVLLGRVAEAQRVDPVASAEERTRVALKQRALAHLADFDKVSCLSETTARVALALLRGGERHAARKRVETCLANDPEQGPALVRLYRLGR